ncbi:hypothetical protein BCR33DRAFT_197923 [Rhizoclosmatium globosum]|uniref:Uncharacterized protein n=1 Tax=Rhizoclosmatium globosum TaxID=329046 RepID=A0A1Y2CE34_9FUNG|nr:hypothetical protein BCR33DRAFT_197923 [Rhizoclosmatium globosum]|eukprot:ORY45282.1 hypothetical protein BCR33DRAFT_197923 [Rhizoclosmatium globosum]
MPASPLITLVLVAAAALAQDPSPTGATNNTAPPLGTPCKTNADCVGIGSACTTDFVCAVSKLDCSLTNLGQCGHDWQTVLSQPTVSTCFDCG